MDISHQRNREAVRNIEGSLKTLVRGLMQNNPQETCEGYKALSAAGPAAIPQIRDAVLKSNWSKITYPEQIRYIGGLVALMHEIDESEARQMSKELKDTRCDPVATRILDGICALSIKDYNRYNLYGIEIFEHTGLSASQNVRVNLEQWLNNIPAEDLKEIERIYILRREDLLSRADYMPVLHRIRLAWDNSSPRWSPMSCINSLIIERTLYHEVGHHVLGHTFGQDAIDEQEAENYADHIMMRTNHWYSKLGCLITSFRR